MSQFNGIYADRSVLVTGDSGFKGSWLTLWLSTLGARVSGLALEPETKPNHSELLSLGVPTFRGDIENGHWLRDCISASKPEIVFHLAAQPLVRRSYSNPQQTWQTNVMGTVNLLDACRDQPSIKAIVLITTDKVYTNQEWAWGYRENDRVGGHDPYSASKACCELVIDSYRSSFFNVAASPALLASARAGNVIGGGDWAEDRLIPDIVRGTSLKQPILVRSPHATRPWQHVLDCLAGYLMIGERLWEGDRSCATAWNIGPNSDDNRQVIEVLEAMKQHWPEMAWHSDLSFKPHEANLLYLDSSKAKTLLGWKPVWNLVTTLEKTATWYKTFSESQQVLSSRQLQTYVNAAQQAGSVWVS